MSIVDDVTAQLVDELGGVVEAVGAVFGPDVLISLLAALAPRCRNLAVDLCSDDLSTAADATLTLMRARWGDREPPPEWWRTPAGKTAARSISPSDTEAVTRAVAAAMLGVHPGTVAQLVARHTLDRHPDGGIGRASVLRRLAR